MVWNPLRDLVARHSDTDRPLRLCEVVDNSRWASSGPSFIAVRLADTLVQAVYRDGPQPEIGTYLHVVQMTPATASPFLALPLPFKIGCAGQLYVSAARTDTGAWDVLRVDLAVGNVWQRRSASPVSGTWPRRPMHSYLGTRLFTWGSSADLATPGPLYYSDDQGATWTGCGISVSNLAMEMKQGLAFAVGGGTLYQSGDQGATWAAVTGPPGGTYYAVATNTSAVSSLVTVLTDSGVYGSSPDSFDVVDAWLVIGIGTPGGAGAWVTAPPGGQPEWFTGGTAYRYTGTTEVLGTLAGGDDSPGRTYGGGGVYHAATGDGHVYTRANTDFSGVIYDPATDHPTALTGIGAQDVYLISGSATPYLHDYAALCLAIALDDATSGTPKLIVRDPEADGDPWTIASTRMLTDLGAEYLISVQGLTTLERWTGAIAG